MSHFHSVRVREVCKETPDCVSIAFDIPAALKDSFTYAPGQHVIMRKALDGEDIRRTYSFCSAPSGGDFRIAVRKVEGGAFSTFANETLKAGDMLELSEPLGEFTLSIDPKRAKHHVGFAVGSGITPIIAMIREVLACEPQSYFHLYYGNRDAEHTIFAEDLAELKNCYMDRFSYQFFLTRQAVDIAFFNGRITGEKAAQLHASTFAHLDVAGYYLCGPMSMIADVRQNLRDAGEPADKIHSELFYADDGDASARKSKPEAIAKSKIKVISDGREIEVDYRDEHGSVLDAVLKAGIDVSFACKGGVCATCRAKVIDGQVDMGLNYGLEPDEIADGFVLTCQSVPTTKSVTISFDE
ncbi:MAG: phenylacetic acid degradation protein [Robiginitomaculum sp.]|nr:MAG: phenylacetic acid degradation protein [Robiginitomaculum sp.]